MPELERKQPERNCKEFSCSTTSGVVMLEFALIAGVLLMAILAVVDFSRYFYIKSQLTKSAEYIVNQAKTASAFRFDLRSPTLESEDLSEYFRVRAEILDEATRQATTSLLHTSRIRLNFSLSAYRLRDASGAAVEHNAMVLFPGDVAELIHPGKNGGSDSYQTVRHPTCSDCPELAVESARNFQLLLSRHPIVAELRASIPLYTLGYQAIEVRSSATAWREVVPYFGAELSLDPDLPPEPFCEELDEQQYCSNLGCKRTEKCDFRPWETQPNCGTCLDQICAYRETSAQACSALGCKENEDCIYLPKSRGVCAECRPAKCNTRTTQEEVCKDVTCRRPRSHCQWLPNNRFPNCGGECIAARCGESLTRQDVCADCLNSPRCEWKPSAAVPKCGGCEPECEPEPGCASWEPYPNCRCCEPPAGGCKGNQIWFGSPYCACRKPPKE